VIAALVPAAGRSSRMGRPKLTLPVRGGGTVIGRVLRALRDGGAERVFLVAPPEDDPRNEPSNGLSGRPRRRGLASETPATRLTGASAVNSRLIDLCAIARSEGAEVIHCPAPTPDMRTTIEHGLRYLETYEYKPLCLLIAPGDAVGLNSQAVAAVVERFRSDPTKLALPTQGARGGHPIALPWRIARTIPALPEGVGINVLKEQHADIIEHVELDSNAELDDIDTPEDYERWRPESLG